MKLHFVVALALLFAFPSALGESASPAPAEVAAAGQAGSVISAIGTAQVPIQPDVALLTFRTISTALSVAEAQSANAEKVQVLYAALEAQGLTAEDFSTSYCRVQTVYSYQYGKLGEGESPSGHSVSQDVVVKLHDVEALGSVIDAALQNGAENSYDLRFESTETQAAYNEALVLATADALRKAQLLAQASHLSLDELLSLCEYGDAAPSFATVPSALSVDGQPQNELSTLMSVSAFVEVRYSTK